MTAARVGARDPLVVGLGSPDRGDDAVGPVVAGRIATLRLPGVRVVKWEDPTSLIDLWTGHDLVVVIDAVCSGQTPGTLAILESGEAAERLPDAAWAGTGRGGTHAFGLAAAIELARALHRLPGRVVLIGIEAGGLGHGEPLSAPVAAAVDAASHAVVALLSDATGVEG